MHLRAVAEAKLKGEPMEESYEDPYGDPIPLPECAVGDDDANELMGSVKLTWKAMVTPSPPYAGAQALAITEMLTYGRFPGGRVTVTIRGSEVSGAPVHQELHCPRGRRRARA